MKNIIAIAILCSAALLHSCNDSRNKVNSDNSKPIVAFEHDTVKVASTVGTQIVDLSLSKPAESSFYLKLFASPIGAVTPGITYKVPDSVLVEAGAAKIMVPVVIDDENLWVTNGGVKIIVKTSLDYGIQSDYGTSVVLFSKQINLPSLNISAAPVYTNPYMSETFEYQVNFDAPLLRDCQVKFAIEGGNVLINNAIQDTIMLKKGATTAKFKVGVAKIDQSGYSATVTLTPTAVDLGSFVVAENSDNIVLELRDPQVDFSGALLSYTFTPANNTFPSPTPSYQVYQYLLTAPNTWSTQISGAYGATGNYLKTFLNMFTMKLNNIDSPVNSPNCDALRLFNMVKIPSGYSLLGYSNTSSSRFFNGVDSLMRFVPQPQNSQKGVIKLNSKRVFKGALVATSFWDASVTPKNWQVDAQKTNGNILKSDYYVNGEKVIITLEKLEGTYDFSDANFPVMFTAWFSTNNTTYFNETITGVSKDGNLYKAQYYIKKR